MLNAVIKFFMWRCLRLLAWAVVYRNGSSVGVAEQRIISAADSRNIPRGPIEFREANRGAFELCFNRVASEYSLYADVLRESPGRS
jgi:hypothetical protein